MQNVKELLDEATKRRQEMVNRFNALEQEKQQILQEVLRLDGEIRILQTLNNDHQKEAL